MIVPLHPGHAHGSWTPPDGEARQAPDVELTAPLGYLDFLTSARHSRAILTDWAACRRPLLLGPVPDVARSHRVGGDGRFGLERPGGPGPGSRPEALGRGRPWGLRPTFTGGGRAGERIRDVVSSYTLRP